MILLPSAAMAGNSRTFAAFNTGTITGGGAAFTRSLDVSGLPASEYLMCTVTADYVPGAAPHDAYSSTMLMELNNGGSTVYSPASAATMGVLKAGGGTTLRWLLVLPRNYTGGGNLTIKFVDPYTDTAGPFTSSLNNVAVSIYPAPVPARSFAPFSTGTITGGGTAFTRSLDVSGLPASEYLMCTVTADYVPGAAPHNAYSSTMLMELNNGGSTVYSPASAATMGVLQAGGGTTLRWLLVLPRTYTGGGNLTIKFVDSFTDTAGPFTSSLNNVAVSIYPAPLPARNFATFNTGTITGGGTAFTRSLDVSGLPPAEYLLCTATADYLPGAAPHNAYSSTMLMELNNGGSTVYFPASAATTGVLKAGGSTTLRWLLVLPRTYTGGGNLTIKFVDPFTDPSGPYTSSLNNVTVSIYPAEAVALTISGNAGAAGVTLSYTDGTAKTTTSLADGTYSFSIPYNWSGTVAPAKAGYVFTPASRSFAGVQTAQTGQNFFANSAPTDLALGATTINQSAASAAAIVGTLGTTDAEGGTMTYSLVGGAGSTDNAAFAVSGSMLKIGPSGLSAGPYTIRLRTTDGGGLFYEKAFSLSVVDNVTPVVVGVVGPPSATYRLHQNLDVIVNFSEPVVLNTAGGTPSVGLTIGTASQSASYLSGSGSTALIFRYTVFTGDTDTDGIAIGASIAANGSTLRDSAGNTATPTFNNIGSTAGVFVDSTPATYADWKAVSFSAAEQLQPSISGPAADPDGSGVTNLMRFALDGPARGPLNSPVTLVTVTDNGQQYLALQFNRRSYAPGLDYVVQASTDLMNWSETVSTWYPGTSATVIARDAVALGSGPRRFLRLQVTQP